MLGDLSALGKLEIPIFCRFSFPNFSIGSVFPVTHLRFCSNIHAWLHIKHLYTYIYAWRPFCTWKTGDTNFLSIQFSELFHWFSFPRHPSKVLFQHSCVATHKTFMHGHLCVVTFLHFIQESAKKNPPK